MQTPAAWAARSAPTGCSSMSCTTTTAASRLLLLSVLQALVALLFLKGFLLTRVELPDVAQGVGSSSSSSSSSAQQPPPYQKAVVLIVDAVRYDFLCGTQPDLSGSFMPKTLRLVQAGGPGAVASRFVADTPTITMSRLKALLTGGLPTFLDVGQSFSASAITEDNLLQQLLARNKSLVMMGDDTWLQLAQHAFTEAYPYPSFNVHDLHTVDDGVWEHLLPLLARPASWDLLIAHYLGVDHAGHTHGVNSRQMEDKLAQMDDQVSTVIESLVSQAGPGGAYEDTLLLVLSDHGQTQGGDHGGGTADETDSILVAVSLRHMDASLEQRQQHQQTADSLKGSKASPSQDEELLLRLLASAHYTDSVPGPTAQHADATAAAAGAEGGGPAGAAVGLPQLMVCGNTVPQIDITPVLAHALGVPIPFGNLGKLPPHLFATLATEKGRTTPADAWLPQYSAALAANAAQVHAYLNRYAAVGGLPAGQLAAANEQYRALQSKQDSWQQEQGGTPADLEAVVTSQLQYLDAAAELARRRFTLFQQGPIWAGCALGVLVLGAQLWYLSLLISRPGDAPGTQARPWDRFSTVAFAGLAAFHAVGMFSVGLLMGEGRLSCVLLAAVTLILLRAALTAVLQARRVAQQAAGTPAQQPVQEQQQAADGDISDSRGVEPARRRLQLVLPAAQVWDSWQPSSQAVRAAASMLVCNVSLQLLGLIDRSGQDPHDKTQPTSDLLVGPDAAWQRAALLAFTVGPLLVVCLFLAAADRLLQGGGLQQTACVPAQGQGAESPKEGLSADLCEDSRQGGGSQGVVWYLRALCALQVLCLGLFWAAQLFGHSDETLEDVCKACWCAALRSPASGLAQAVSGLAGRVAGLSSGAVLSGALCSLPLRLLLPRVIYTAALVALAAAALLAVLHRLPVCCKVKGWVQADPVLLLWLCASLAAPLVMVLGFKGPATMLLALLQAAGLCKLLRLRSAAVGFVTAAAAAPSNSSTSNNKQVTTSSAGAVGAEDDGCCSVVGAGAWGLMALQLFFCSGHFCEFSGLQYASAFIGFDDMVWYTSGSLLLVNTCWFLFLGPLSLPVLMAACAAGKAGGGAAALLRPQVECGLWVANSMRFAALVASLLSAAVQQQHILLWAIFAPKLVFELAFMMVTAAGQLLVAGIFF